jgi:hypothetical protein
MPDQSITGPQLKRLQTLWSQYARHALWDAASREQRIKWASSIVKRQISSFNDLTLMEAKDLITLIQTELGIGETSPAISRRRPGRRIKDREAAHAAGTEGRRGHRDKLTIATTKDFQLIDSQLTDMGWTRERLDAFLRSPSSPLGARRSNPQLRTLADVNRVYWALKRLADRQARVGGSQ